MKKIKSMNDVMVLVAQLEAGRKQVSIAQIKEVVRCLADILVENPEANKVFVAYLNRKLKKVKKC